jgi:hypothetical protein
MSHLVSSSFGRKAGRQEHTSRREEKLKAKKGRMGGGKDGGGKHFVAKVQNNQRKR